MPCPFKSSSAVVHQSAKGAAATRPCEEGRKAKEKGAGKGGFTIALVGVGVNRIGRPKHCGLNYQMVQGRFQRESGHGGSREGDEGGKEGGMNGKRRREGREEPCGTLGATLQLARPDLTALTSVGRRRWPLLGHKGDLQARPAEVQGAEGV